MKINLLKKMFFVAIMLTSSVIFAQTVSGIVTEDTGNPLPGVTVIIKGTTKGTSTDFDGAFSLLAANGDVLEFSYIGFKTQSVTVSSNTKYNITLETDSAQLDEVVVVGYGKQKRSTLTGAVSTVESSELATVPVADMSNSIVGRVAGLVVTNESGQPGFDGSDILIRGIGSNAEGVGPLFIVDGVPRDLFQLDPNSVESISVLKDAAAVAPYGMAGANGVILVTTKRGKSGAPTIALNTYTGWQNNAILPNLTKGYDNAILRNRINENSGVDPAYTDLELETIRDGSDPLNYPSHDVLKEIFTSGAPISSVNFNISGGNENVTYFVNLGYLNQEGVLPKTSFKRYNLVANIDIKLTETTKFSTSINGRVENRKAPEVSLIDAAYKFSPLAPLRWPNGLAGSYNGSSPVGRLNSGSFSDNSLTSVYTQFALEQQLPFIEGLSIKGLFNYDPEEIHNKNWHEITKYYDYNATTKEYDAHTVGANSSLAEGYSKSQSFTYQGFINYNNTFGNHDVTGLVLLESRNTKYSEFGASRNNYSVPIPELNNGSSSAQDKDNYGSSTERAQQSALYRLTYAFKSKYLFEASGRWDANSYFAPGHRWGFFPAVSAGWRVSEESFFKNNASWINNLKIRGSYGESGALPSEPYQYLAAYNLYGGAAVFGDNVYSGLVESIEPNERITWERARKSNIGFEMNIKDGLFTLEADYFYEYRTGMLIAPQAEVPIEYGVALAQTNSGEMKNQGFEITTGIMFKPATDFTIRLNGNFTYAKNKLMKVSENAATFNNPNRRRTGKPLGTRFGYNALGLFQLSDDTNNDGIINSDDGYNVNQLGSELHPGDIKYEDVNGDGEINEDDIKSIGVAYIPEIVYGFGSNIAYKGFDFDVMFQGAANRSINLEYERAFPFSYGSGMATEEMLDYWTPENPDAKFPRLDLGGADEEGSNGQVSNWWNRDASYLRLKSTTFGYNFSSSILDNLKLNSLRLYVSGTNLFTWSPFTDFDPELSQDEGFRYPQQKVISIGANITF